MANIRRGNTWYIDTSASLIGDTGASTYQQDGKSIRIIGIFFTPNAAGQSLTINDEDGSSQNAKVTIKGTAQYDTKYYDLSNTPIVTNGIDVVITAGATATLILG